LADTDLYAVANRISYVDSEVKNGTTLFIGGLRDKWSEASIKRIYRYVAAIIQPYPLSKEHKSEEKIRKKETRDPGFSVSLYKKTGKQREVIADESSMIFRYAVASVEGLIDENGNGLYSLESKRFDIDKTEAIGKDRENPQLAFSELRSIQFKAHYFIYHPDLIPTQQRTYIQELAEEIGGIRLYNNGFRVLPYGEPFADWLRLDQSVRKRQILPPHGNNNFFGFVEVSENSNLMEETSSREGLQENQAFSELQDFVYRCLVASATEVARARGIKERASQKNWDKKKERPKTRVLNFTKRIVEEAEEFERELKKIPEYSDKTKLALGVDGATITDRFKEIAKEIEGAILEQSEEEELLIKELGMLRVLASLGLTIGGNSA
jgi:hypothetical protein